MRKRLRKKNHVGEFQQFGFYVALRLWDPATEDELEELWDVGLVEGVIVGRNLRFTGGWNQMSGLGFVTGHASRSASVLDRQAVISHLARHPQVSDHEVGPLVDAWRGPDPGPEFSRFQLDGTACCILLPHGEKHLGGPKVAACAIALGIDAETLRNRR